MIFLFDFSTTRCFMNYSTNFEGVLLEMRGYTCVLRGCSCTLKTHNYPPLYNEGGRR